MCPPDAHQNSRGGEKRPIGGIFTARPHDRTTRRLLCPIFAFCKRPICPPSHCPQPRKLSCCACGLNLLSPVLWILGQPARKNCLDESLQYLASCPCRPPLEIGFWLLLSYLGRAHLFLSPCWHYTPFCHFPDGHNYNLPRLEQSFIPPTTITKSQSAIHLKLSTTISKLAFSKLARQSPSAQKSPPEQALRYNTSSLHTSSRFGHFRGLKTCEESSSLAPIQPKPPGRTEIRTAASPE